MCSPVGRLVGRSLVSRAGPVAGILADCID